MEKLNEMWNEFSLAEKISLTAGAICTAIILGLLISAKGAVETVLPYVMSVGAVEFLAGAVFIWRRDKKRALMIGICGPAMCILILVLIASGQI